MIDEMIVQSSKLISHDIDELIAGFGPPGTRSASMKEWAKIFAESLTAAAKLFEMLSR